ncbi:MAG TPA: hypothetical protein VFA07_12390 [Chthonomonadaceae bacterium]|nr:hypothetical protein [Chthonomonadaceae bacterium]
MQQRYLTGLALLGGVLSVAGAGVTRDLPWVRQRVQQWQPTARERRWEDIGWAQGLREALRLASRHQRPVFLFTHDGHLNVGRC